MYISNSDDFDILSTHYNEIATKMNNFLQFNKTSFLLLCLSIVLLTTYLQQEYVVIPTINNMQVINEVIKAKIVESYFRYRWLMFLAPVAIFLIRISLVALCLFVGCLLTERQQKIKYIDSWNITLKSDIVLILFSVLICVVSIFAGAQKSVDFVQHNSLVFLVNSNITEQWLIVPIAALNIFEVCYWFFMAKLVSLQTKDGYWSSFRFVMSSYGVGYLFYIVFLMFLLLYLAN